MDRLPDKLRAEIKAAARAAVDSHYGPLKDRKRQELRELELAHQETLESLERDSVIERWLQGENVSDGSPQIPHLSQEVPDSTKEAPVKRNGASSAPSRRVMLLSVLPTFKDTDFIRRDVEAKIFEKWPEVKPETEIEYRNFGSNLANLLTDLMKKGQLESTKGETPFDPTVYRLKSDFEDTLLKSGP